ncbi:MAG: LamG domain-containing protein [Victivallaceae bacterium]|nr:LamG domain-containing protein [Victivallaceae bacterium]
MFYKKRLQALGILLTVGSICLSSSAANQTATFATKLTKLTARPTVALSFVNDKITVTGSAKVTVTPNKGELVFVAGQDNEVATVISDQDIGVTALNISGGKICSATEGSFSVWFTPLAAYDDNPKQRHYFFSGGTNAAAVYFYITGNSRLTLQFKQVVNGKPSWPAYQFDFKWAKKNEKFVAGKWYHIAATWNAETAVLYINGVKRQKKTAMHKTVVDFSTITLGAYFGKKNINAAMTNVAFFDKCLTPEAIKILAAK